MPCSGLLLRVSTLYTYYDVFIQDTFFLTASVYIPSNIFTFKILFNRMSSVYDIISFAYIHNLKA